MDYSSSTKSRYSKYIQSDYEDKITKKIVFFYMICYYIMPQYFGVDLGVFAFTAQRIGMVILLLYFLCSRKRVRRLWEIIRSHELLIPMCIYLFVTLYTAVYRVNIGSFMYSVIEFINIFLLLYIIKEVYGIEEFSVLIKKFITFLCIMGFVEAALGFSPFSKLETISGSYAGAGVRSGSYRVMGPCNHSLAYGLLLVTATPFICIDFKNDRINILQNKVVLILITANVFLTGSRSSLAVYLLELGLLYIFSYKENRKKTFITLLISVLALSLAVVATYGSGFSNYVLLQVTSIIDQIAGTQLSVNYGADITAFTNSSTYRSYLPLIFSIDSLNPLIGRGSGYHFTWFYEGFFIKSIDNFYVATYIRFGYPGLISYCLYLGIMGTYMVKHWIRAKSGLAGAVFIGSFCYFLNLWWMDTLQTIKYAYILFAFFLIYYQSNKQNEIKPNKKNSIKSKYIR